VSPPRSRAAAHHQRLQPIAARGRARLAARRLVAAAAALAALAALAAPAGPAALAAPAALARLREPDEALHLRLHATQ